MTFDLDNAMDRNKKSPGISVCYQNVEGLIPFVLWKPLCKTPYFRHYKNF